MTLSERRKKRKVEGKKKGKKEERIYENRCNIKERKKERKKGQVLSLNSKYFIQPTPLLQLTYEVKNQ